MRCKRCDFNNVSRARFCAGCGISIAKIMCEDCRFENQAMRIYCQSCGRSLALVNMQETSNEDYSPERRLLTVMFSDIVGSTKMVEYLDVEEMRSIVRKYQSICKDIIVFYGGRITEYLGDGIVAQFTRHETNAEGAIHAAMEINKQTAEVIYQLDDKATKLEVRCGIASGLAVVGDVLGDAKNLNESAVGLPLNLAARLLSLAKPGEILISNDSKKLIGHVFDYKDAGKHKLKGISREQQIWQVDEVSSMNLRFLAKTQQALPLIGRKKTLTSLTKQWQKALNGTTNALALIGEAGIGKSRIIQEFRRLIEQDEYYCIEFQCAEYHRYTSLYPIIRQLEYAAVFKNDDTDSVKTNKLSSLLSTVSENLNVDMPLYINMLSLPANSSWHMPNLEAAQIKENLFMAYINNLKALSTKKPLLVIVEDVHWLDPTSQELLHDILQTIMQAPILFLITSRQELQSEISSLENVSQLNINKLPPLDAKMVVDAVLKKSNLSKQLIEGLIQRADGVPLYLEELSKGLKENLQTVDPEHNISQTDIPVSLFDSFLTRLDKLPASAKSLAQIAAVIGRDFSHDLLTAAANLDGIRLAKGLTPLFEAKLIFENHPPPNAEYSFQHALARDAIYESLLQDDRAKLHLRVGQTLENFQPINKEHNYELLAQHFSAANQYRKAVSYWVKAGKVASQNSAIKEAEINLLQARSQLKLVENEKVRHQLELEILVALGTIFYNVKGAKMQETMEVYQRASELCKQLPESELHFAVLWSRWLISIDSRLDFSLDLADQLEAMATKLDSVDLKLQAHHAKWTSYFNYGKVSIALEHCKKGIGLYKKVKHVEHVNSYAGHDPLICAYSFGAQAYWLMGFPKKSLEFQQKSTELADELNHIVSSLRGFEGELTLYKFRQDPKRVIQCHKRFHQISNDDNYSDYEARFNIFKGWAIAKQGRVEQGIKLMRESIDLVKSEGTWEDMPMYVEMFAEVCPDDHVTEALVYLDEGIKIAEDYMIQFWAPELYRRKGLLLLRDERKNYQRSIELVNKALALAKKNKMRMLALRSLISLIEILEDEKSKSKAIAQVKNLYDEFSEGKDSVDLKLAKSKISEALV